MNLVAASMVVGAAGLDHRRQLGRDHEDGPAHAEHADQRAFGVQGLLDVARPGRAGASPGGQVDRRRVGAMQRDDVRHRVRDRASPLRRRQVMPARQPGPPLGHADRPDPPAGSGNGAHHHDPTRAGRSGSVAL